MSSENVLTLSIKLGANASKKALREKIYKLREKTESFSYQNEKNFLKALAINICKWETNSFAFYSNSDIWDFILKVLMTEFNTHDYDGFEKVSNVLIKLN